MRVMGLIGALAVCGLVAGCSKASDDDVQPIPQAELPGAVANAFCESLAGCCQHSQLAFDTTHCRQSATLYFQQGIGPESPNLVYDAQAGGNCLAELRANLQCGVARDDGAVNACDHLFVGKVPLGGACTSSNECARPAKGLVRCESDGFSAGVCTSVTPTRTVRGMAGQACFANCSAGDCSSVYFDGAAAPGGAVVLCYTADGLFCNENAVCQGLARLGEPCHYYDSCAGKAFCDMETARCLAPRANGAVCLDGSECQSKTCNNGVCAGSATVDPLVCAASELPLK